ncbi:MAG: hypothetical protein ACOC4R_00710, partial [Bacteroidota bacterium]
MDFVGRAVSYVLKTYSRHFRGVNLYERSLPVQKYKQIPWRGSSSIWGIRDYSPELIDEAEDLLKRGGNSIICEAVKDPFSVLYCFGLWYCKHKE